MLVTGIRLWVKGLVSTVLATGEIRATELKCPQLQWDHRSEGLYVHGARNWNKCEYASECMTISKHQAGLGGK